MRDRDPQAEAEGIGEGSVVHCHCRCCPVCGCGEPSEESQDRTCSDGRGGMRCQVCLEAAPAGFVLFHGGDSMGRHHGSYCARWNSFEEASLEKLQACSRSDARSWGDRGPSRHLLPSSTGCGQSDFSVGNQGCAGQDRAISRARPWKAWGVRTTRRRTAVAGGGKR